MAIVISYSAQTLWEMITNHQLGLWKTGIGKPYLYDSRDWSSINIRPAYKSLLFCTRSLNSIEGQLSTHIQVCKPLRVDQIPWRNLVLQCAHLKDSIHRLPDHRSASPFRLCDCKLRQTRPSTTRNRSHWNTSKVTQISTKTPQVCSQPTTVQSITQWLSLISSSKPPYSSHKTHTLRTHTYIWAQWNWSKFSSVSASLQHSRVIDSISPTW